jgi:hypothetical protein
VIVNKNELTSSFLKVMTVKGSFTKQQQQQQQQQQQ